MKKLFLFLIAISSTMNISAQWTEDIVTTAELSNYQSTSTYADVMDVINGLQQRSELISVEYMGQSPEGKNIPLVIMSDPAISTPEQAKASGKPVIYIQGNIHAGEVEGKEVLQILMREILLGDKKYLLEDQILVFAPIYNTDSNDKMEEGRRRSQEDSPREVGMRSNSQGLDLNRDGIKMEADETKALIENVILRWDPELLVDLHTTNGTWHGYSLTWAPSYHYAGEKAPYDLTWNDMLPQVTKNVKEKFDVYLGPYGGYSLRQGWPPEAIYTYNHHPRYIVNQMGLRNKMGILSEAFAHERFYERIRSTYAFVHEILEYTSKNGRMMMRINQQAEEEAIRKVREEAGSFTKGVRFRMVPMDNDFTLRTYEYESYTDEAGEDRFFRKGQIIEIPGVKNYSRFEATAESRVPRAYLIPKEYRSVVEHIRSQGAEVKTLKRRTTIDAEVFIATEFTLSPRVFEGHNMATVEGKFRSAETAFEAGDYIVDMAQPLTNLIFYTLEPKSDDGLVTWNFFDEVFNPLNGQRDEVEYPVYKVYNLEGLTF
ncbi:M14 family metallopeptidase [Balneola sp. MJW-20]|uniref:M14 family metallopeptidase n=1 Tax=Gracilimonas aurantiaca TaxID=3234185 RepID=UPI0034652FBA